MPAKTNAHAPPNPSQLREVYVPSEGSASPENTMHSRPLDGRHGEPHAASSAQHGLDISSAGIQPEADHASVHSNPENERGILGVDLEPTVRSRLLNHQNWDASSCCEGEHCTHGTMSPRPCSQRSYGTVDSSSRAAFGGPYPGASPPAESVDTAHALLGDTFTVGLMPGGLGKNGKKVSTTKYLADQHGIKNQRLM